MADLKADVKADLRPICGRCKGRFEADIKADVKADVKADLRLDYEQSLFPSLVRRASAGGDKNSRSENGRAKTCWRVKRAEKEGLRTQ